jgi:hypothetical protein
MSASSSCVAVLHVPKHYAPRLVRLCSRGRNFVMRCDRTIKIIYSDSPQNFLSEYVAHVAWIRKFAFLRKRNLRCPVATSEGAFLKWCHASWKVHVAARTVERGCRSWWPSMGRARCAPLPPPLPRASPWPPRTPTPTLQSDTTRVSKLLMKGGKRRRARSARLTAPV